MEKISHLEIINYAKSVLVDLKIRREALPGFESNKKLSESTLHTYESTYRSLINKAELIRENANDEAVIAEDLRPNLIDLDIESANFEKKLLIDENRFTGDIRESLINIAMDTKVLSTWFKRKAALIYKFRTDIKSSFNEYKQAQTPQDAEQKLLEIETLSRLLSQIDKAKIHIPRADRPRSKTKKSQLKKLQKVVDWKFEIYKRMPTYRAQIATLTMTGCRPCELVKGVLWKIEGYELIAEIKGAKVGLHSGQEERKIMFNLTSDVSKAMYKLVKSNGGSKLISTPSAINLTNAIRSAGKRAFPNFKHSITSYSFRHQLSADLKSDGTGGDDISKILGHCSARTKAYYGVRKQGNGSKGHIKSITATREIKPPSESSKNFLTKHNILYPKQNLTSHQYI